MTFESNVVSGARVELDPWGTNPLAEDIKQASPYGYHAAVREAGPPPKLFAGGQSDLPAFTTSGADPKVLLKLPWTARHAAAAASAAELHQLLENRANDPDTRINHPGLADAISRMRDWAKGTGNYSGSGAS